MAFNPKESCMVWWFLGMLDWYGEDILVYMPTKVGNKSGRYRCAARCVSFVRAGVHVATQLQFLDTCM